MNDTLIKLQRVAEVEFAEIVEHTFALGTKLRITLTDTSYIDVWASQKIVGRFGFHWERRHLDESIYRYDNFPDTNWRDVATFPFHFHSGSQDNVVAAPFSSDLETSFREFLDFVADRIASR